MLPEVEGAKPAPLFLDIDAYDTQPSAEEGLWLVLKDPKTGNALPGRVRLKGADSQSWKDKLLEQRRRRLEELDKGGKSRVDPARIEEEDLERLVTVTVDWELRRAGAPWPCTPANAAAFWKRWPDFAEQAANFIANRANFYPRPAASS